jgi:hypothetical protein
MNVPKWPKMKVFESWKYVFGDFEGFIILIHDSNIAICNKMSYQQALYHND